MSISLKFVGKFVRLILLAAWAGLIFAAIAFYLSDPSKFTASNIAAFINTFQTQIWLVYFGMSLLRGFTLLPSTPLVLAGTVLYPDQPWLIFATSMTGILVSSTLIYFCSEALGFSEYFESKKPQAVIRLRHHLERPFGLTLVCVWAFFPFVPTDAVCYVAGTTRMHFAKFIMAIGIGESALCSIYVFSAGFLVRNWL
jgi:uncharacterized membrane protein YdjX (TVP38/TMEM64 family)